MATLLLVVIYLAFISLGLPDALLGGAWPVMQPDLGVPLEFAGLASMIVTGEPSCRASTAAGCSEGSERALLPR